MNNAVMLGLMTVLFWSTSATAFKLTLRTLDVLQLLLVAIATATLILGGYLAITGRMARVFALERRKILRSLVLGFLNPFVYYWMAVKAYDLLPAQVVQPINYTWVITLSLLAVPLLKQPLTRYQILATLVSYAGVVVLSYRSGTGEEISYVGVFLAISCTLIWALYWIANVKSQEDPVVDIFLNFLFALPFTALACALFSSLSIRDVHGILGALWIGCFEFGFAFITWIIALKKAGSTHYVTNLIFLTPFVSLIFIRLVLGEQILTQTYVGLGMIILGIVVQKTGEYLTARPS